MKKKSTGTKNKELLEQYRRERRRVNQLIRRAEKRGFIIPKSAKPGKPLKRPTEKSIERLKAITPEAIYERAKYKSQGKTYRGEEARKIARKEAREQTAKKKAEQAKSKAEQAAREEAEKIFNIEITELEKAAEKPAPTPETESIEPSPKEADIIIHNVEEALPEPDDENEFEVGYGEGAIMDVEEELESWERPSNSSDWYAEKKEKDKDKMRRLFHEVLERDGVEEVAKRIENSGERFKQLLDRILYGSDGRGDLERDFAEMAAILYGRPLTVDESITVTWWGE
ncbi:MAG: hypothetical protein IIW79_05015 [Clostridia bacterium]|nr:hypothetical protein [Clostridia bacterium]